MAEGNVQRSIGYANINKYKKFFKLKKSIKNISFILSPVGKLVVKSKGNKKVDIKMLFSIYLTYQHFTLHYAVQFISQ